MNLQELMSIFVLTAENATCNISYTMMHGRKNIKFLYMFRATMCPSSEEITVSMRYLVFVTQCGWLSVMQGEKLCTKLALFTRLYKDAGQQNLKKKSDKFARKVGRPAHPPACVPLILTHSLP